MDATELKLILDLHAKWLRSEAGGVRAAKEAAKAEKSASKKKTAKAARA